jgi:hypothetical protein
VHLDNIYLVPGDNNITLRGAISQGPVLTALAMQPYCSNGGLIPFDLNGNGVVNNGQSLSYFAAALASANVTTAMNIGGALKSSLNVTVPCAA